MKLTARAISTSLALLIIFIISTATPCAAFTPKDHYLLSCGASSADGASFDGRTWQSDDNQTFSSSFASTTNATATSHDRSVTQIPFWTARIFRTKFTYSFPVTPGPKFLRLFFYPATYSGSDPSQFFFSVEANNHLLLHNFSAYLSAVASGESFLSKEYYVNVLKGTDSLNLSFAPTPPSPLAFVNGIELVSIPDGLYVDSTRGLKNVDSPNNPYTIIGSVAMETVYRLNVGGSEVEVSGDGSETGMYRLWKDKDYTYMTGDFGITGLKNEQKIIYTQQTPSYTAPQEVYRTFRSMGLDAEANLKNNLTWRFPVDGAFTYLLRLHWCEVVVDVNMTNERVFSVDVNNQTAEERADILEWSQNVQNTALYRDYVVFVNKGDGSSSTSFIWLAMHPVTDQNPRFEDALLNGLEIFKISRSEDGSLNSPNPNPQLPSHLPVGQAPGKPSKKPSLPAIIGGVAGGILVVSLLLGCFIFRHRRRVTKLSSGSTETSSKKTRSSKTSTAASSLPSDLCRHFSFSQIRLATSDFSSELIIGSGGFGHVYKGIVDADGVPLKVAIKRSNPMSKQGAREFRTEIEMLSKLRHVHLVSLIGYCDDNGEMILVYEYMSRGTLRDHLYNSDNPPLSWIQRLQICVGAARGLHYLHAGATNMIIHRDVKTTNILIDDKWVAKVSDFGLSKLGPTDGDQATHVSTMVKGSFGYVDPEYYRRQQLTQKSDVYSFGVVLFEVLCGRAAVNPALTKEQVNLAVWARSYQRRGAIGAIVDPSLKGQIAPECLRVFGGVAERCVRDSGMERPAMADVVWSLEFALQQQQAADAETGSLTVHVAKEIAEMSSSSATTPLRRHDSLEWFTCSSEENQSKSNESSSFVAGSSFEDYSGSSSKPVFSEIFRPEGR